MPSRSAIDKPTELAETRRRIGRRKALDRFFALEGLLYSAALQRLDRAWGEQPDPRERLQPPERFAEHLELSGRTDDVERLRRFCGLVSRRLEQHAALALAVGIMHVDLQQEARVEVGIKHPGHAEPGLAQGAGRLQERSTVLAVGGRVHHDQAAILGVELDEVRFETEGDIDLNGFFGLRDGEGRPVATLALWRASQVTEPKPQGGPLC
mgnify:CR=1 FL=1